MDFRRESEPEDEGVDRGTQRSRPLPGDGPGREHPVGRGPLGKAVPRPRRQGEDGKCTDEDDKGTDNNGGTGTGNNGTGSGSGGGYGSGDSYSNGGSYSGGVFNGGVTLVNGFLPNTFASTLERTGNSVKSSLPAPVAKTLPNTGGGWFSLALVGGMLLLTGRFLIRRFSN